MFRLILALIIAWLIWLLFYSKFNKKQKTITAIITVIVFFFGAWLEQLRHKPIKSAIPASELIVCNIKAQHSYRSNYDISICLHNTNQTFEVRKLKLDIIALHCLADKPCVELEKNTRFIEQTIGANSQLNLTLNLRFDKAENKPNLSWQANIKEIYALPINR